MAFRPRPPGLTLRRIEDAIARPHDPAERMDPDFPVAVRCEDCGQLGFSPRRLIAEAIRDHRESSCPKRRTHADDPIVSRILYPRT